VCGEAPPLASACDMASFSICLQNPLLAGAVSLNYNLKEVERTLRGAAFDLAALEGVKL